MCTMLPNTDIATLVQANSSKKNFPESGIFHKTEKFAKFHENFAFKKFPTLVFAHLKFETARVNRAIPWL